MKVKWIRLGMLLIASALLMCSLFFGYNLAAFSNTMSIKYKETGLSSAQIESIHSEGKTVEKEFNDIPYIIGWDKTEDVLIENLSIGMKMKVNLLEIYGDMNAVYPAPLLAGSYAEKSDKKGCVISCKTAEELFHSSQVIGCNITFENKQYIIRGILKSKEPLIMIQAERDTAFPFLEFQYNNEKYAASNTKAMLSQLGLPAYESFAEGNFYVGAAYLFIGFPFLILLLLLTFAAKEKLLRNDTTAWRYVKISFIAAAFILLTLLLAKYCIVFSDDFIPSRISDFEFWTNKFSELEADYSGMLNYQMWYKDAMIISNLKYIVLTSVGAAVLFLAAGLMRN